MNKPIRRVSVVAMVMFCALLINLTQFSIFQTPNLNADPLNRRARDAEFGQDRGAIVAGTKPMAQSKASKGQFAFQRNYTNGPIYAPITGYYSYDHAASGLEATYTEELAGTTDSLFIRRFLDTLTGKPPKGASLETTIAPGAQELAYKLLGDQKGAVVAMDAKTGAILTMASTPSYDPNLIATHDIKKAGKSFAQLASDKSRPMANRAAREIYPPGSVFKLVTAAAALESGMNPASRLASPSTITLPGTQTKLGNDTNCGGTTITIDKALQTSCNTAFANLGLELGTEKLAAQSAKFGFGAKHLDELRAVASRFPATMNRAQLAMSSIGQYDVATSPLQMTMVAAGIANDGVVAEPYLVHTVRGPNLEALQQHRVTTLPRAMSTANAKALQDMMVHVVESGTGTSAQAGGIRIGGKTGTAQSAPDRPPYAWFTAFGEKDGRTIAVSVFIESADIPRNEIAGGRLAAPIARDVLKELLR